MTGRSGQRKTEFSKRQCVTISKAVADTSYY